MTLLTPALVTTLCLLATVVARGEYCYNDDEARYLFFASKTAYEFARTPHQGEEPMPHCTPLQVWWLNRHGTRYPGKKTIVSMEKLYDLRDIIIRNHNERSGQLCDADLENLRGWRLRTNESLDNVLTTAGEDELKFTAKRLRERFPAALTRTYSTKAYKFRHTDTQRTYQSARKFAEGLFDQSDLVHIPPALPNDTLLRPYKSCKAWQEKDDLEPTEWRKLIDGEDMTKLVRDVSTRLGYLGSLKFEDVRTIYDMCRNDKAWFVDETSPWCAAFIKEELQLLEYAEDMWYYFKSGYGDDDAVKLGCPLAKDLLERFQPLAEGAGRQQEQPVGVFYFAHSSTLHMLQSRLGFFRDERPLQADNRPQQTNRQWRISKMGSFAATLGAIFYRCSNDLGNSSHVLFLSNEGPVDVTGCRVGLCTWEHVRDLLQPISDQCNLDWCEPGSALALVLPRIPTLLAVAVMALLTPSLLAF